MARLFLSSSLFIMAEGDLPGKKLCGDINQKASKRILEPS
jgi:hypothetical protein